jgi:hypothetical protein
MNHHFALLSLVYMMSFVIVFENLHYRRAVRAWVCGSKLMSSQDLAKIQAILSACQES